MVLFNEGGKNLFESKEFLMKPFDLPSFICIILINGSIPCSTLHLKIKVPLRIHRIGHKILSLRDARYRLLYVLGWRRTMEDAAISELDLGDKNSLFAVFDGHGGIKYMLFRSLGCYFCVEILSFLTQNQQILQTSQV